MVRTKLFGSNSQLRAIAEAYGSDAPVRPLRATFPVMWGRIAGRRVMEFGTPGAMRQRLTALVVAGRKTATAGLLDEDYAAEDEPLEHIGEELAVVDNSGDAVAVIAVDSVEVVPFAAVEWEFADAEGEGFTSIEHWRTGHHTFWQEQGIEVADETSIVCLRFHLVTTAEHR